MCWRVRWNADAVACDDNSCCTPERCRHGLTACQHSLSFLSLSVLSALCSRLSALCSLLPILYSLTHIASDWATSPRTGGRPSQELAGDQPQNWQLVSGVAVCGCARRHSVTGTGDQPEDWRATNPRTGGRPTQELAGDRTQELAAGEQSVVRSS